MQNCQTRILFLNVLAQLMGGVGVLGYGVVFRGGFKTLELRSGSRV